MCSPSASHFAPVALFCSVVLLGISVPGCDVFGPKSDQKPDYVGIWVDENRTVVSDRSTITVDFYLVLTENRVSKWQHAQDGETGCRSAGADVLAYDPKVHKLTVAPDSGEARVKHYIERQGDQIIFSERYIFYALGRSDTLDLTQRDPASLAACQGKG